MLTYEWIATIVGLTLAVISLIDTTRKVRSYNGYTEKSEKVVRKSKKYLPRK